MGYIGNRSWILFIEERYAVCFVHCNRQVEYWKPFIILGFSELDDVDITGIAVLVSRIIGNIDPAFMVSAAVPFIQEPDALVFGDRAEKPADLGIAVYRHLFCKERMRKCEIRIILAGVFFFYDQVCNQIQHETGIIAKTLSEHWDKFILVQYFLNNDT